LSETVTPFAFTDQQKVDIRRYCGYPFLGDGVIVFPFPWIMREYLALETRMANITPTEAAVVVTYLESLAILEAAIPAASSTQGTQSAAVWTRNPNEIRERKMTYDLWRRELCGMMDVPPGPNLSRGSRGMSWIV
jgi:hypothetical protein